MKKLAVIFACLACLMFVGFGIQPKPVMAAGNTYYVAKNGNDKNSGSLSSPWLTIQHAAEIATAGDTINIESGTYTESITPWNSGTASSYITYQNYNGGVVNIDGGSSYTNINTSTQSYLEFIGLNCIGATTVGMLVPEAGHILVQDCYFANCTEQGLSISGAYVTVNGCTVTGVNSAGINECISLEGATYFTVENCIVHDPVASGRAGIDAKDGCSNGNINNNTVYNCSGGGIYLDGGGSPQYNINVYDNLVYNNAPFPGLVINCENSPANQTNLNFYNNIVYGNGTGFASWNSAFTETFSLINNTFYNNDGVSIEVFEPSPYNVNCVLRNNIIFESTSGAAGILIATTNDTGVAVDHNLFYNAGGSWRSGNVLGTSYVAGNPLLINPTTNFNISSNSPAIGAGSGTLAPSTDYVGTSRPQGAGYDIGAYEYKSLLVVTISTLANGTVGASYSQTLTASGGVPPYSWATASGNLPGGLSLSSSGVISGTPTTVGGPTPVIFQVIDSANTTATASLSITVNGSLSITTSSLSNGTVGTAYSQALTAVGGTGSYNWTIVSGSLPIGLSLNSDGIISGTPATSGGPISLTFQVNDSTNTTRHEVVVYCLDLLPLGC